MDLLDMCLDFGADSLRVDDLLLDPIVSTPTPRPTLVTFPDDDFQDTFDDLDCDLDKLVADLRAEGVPTPVALDTPPVAPQPKKKRKPPSSAGRGTKRSKNSSVDTTSPDVRAGCSCSKRQCRTMYCVCFRAGRACDPEICVRCAGSCCNTEDNPAGVRRERRGFCACRKTKCDKNYCECRLAGVECGPKCHCNKDCCANLGKDGMMKMTLCQSV